MSKEYSVLNRSTVSCNPAGNVCPKHPGYELTYFNSKEGRKQCLMCIMHSSVAEGGRERFCVKHPGYENSFYCYNDQKVCCEKCLNYHKKHKLESIALKAESLRERFDDYKGDFIDISQQWISFYNETKEKKDLAESNIEAAGKSIESVFDFLIQRLNKKKVEVVTEFRERARKTMTEFDAKFAECEADVKDISQHTDDFNRLEELFKEGNNLEVILRSMELGIEDLIDNYCPFLKEKLGHHKEIFEEIKGKTGSNYAVENKFNEKEFDKFVSSLFTIKSTDTKSKSFEQPLSPPVADLPFKKLAEPSITDLFLHRLDPKGLLWVYQNQTFSSVPLAFKLKSPARSFRSSAGDIFAFECGAGTKTVYRYLPDAMAFDTAFTLPLPYTNLSIVENKGDLYMGGTSESAGETVLPQIFCCDPATGDIEAVGSGLPKLSNFVLATASRRYLYVLQLASQNPKAFRTDTTLAKTSSSSAIKESLFDWEETSIANGDNLQLSPPLWTCELEDFIMIVGGNGSALFNWKKGQIVDRAKLEEADSLMDGIFTNGKEVWAYGSRGVHFYSLQTKKWSLIPQD